MICSCQKEIHKTEFKPQSATERDNGGPNPGTDCWVQTPNCQAYGINPHTSIISMPGYGSCLAVCTYEVYECDLGNPNIKQIVFKNFNAKPSNSPDCDGLREFWAYLYNTGQYALLAQRKNEYNQLAREIVEDEFMTYLILNDKIKYDCNNLNTTLSSKFIHSICYNYCVKIEIIGGKPQVVDSNIKKCGTQCCERLVEWCWDSQNMKVKSSIPVYSTMGESCAGPVATCPLGYLEVPDNCQQTCIP